MNICILIGTFRSDIAYRVITEKTSLIKSYRVDFHFLADKLFEKRIINAEERKQVTNPGSGMTADERLQILINYIKEVIKIKGEVFGTFIDILKEENTIRSAKLADQLMDGYKLLSNPASTS